MASLHGVPYVTPSRHSEMLSTKCGTDSVSGNGGELKSRMLNLLGELGDRKFEKVLLIFLMQESSIFLNIRTFFGGGFVLFLQVPFQKI